MHHAWRRIARSAAALRARLTPGRLLTTVAICAIVSTQIWFQPQLYGGFSLESTLRACLDYFGECLLMGVPMMLALVLVEGLAARASRPRAIAAVALALVGSATVGRLLLIPYYDFPWSDAFDHSFWSDVIYWVGIAGGTATIYSLQQRAAAAALALHQAQVDPLELSRQMLEAQLQVMRAQIEPHFLFNVLANVKRLCQTDLDGGLALLENLVRYLRAALPQMREERTTLGQEVDLVRAYLAVFQIRMGERLRYRIDVPAELRAQPFPPMMLLSLVENAIKHGISPSTRGGTIEVRAGTSGDAMEIRVADTGVGFGAAQTGGTGIGLANTRARLTALHGDAGVLGLSANEPCGVVVTLRVPLAVHRRDSLAIAALA